MRASPKYKLQFLINLTRPINDSIFLENLIASNQQSWTKVAEKLAPPPPPKKLLLNTWVFQSPVLTFQPLTPFSML